MYKDGSEYKGQILKGNIRDSYGTLKRHSDDDNLLSFKYEGPFLDEKLGEGPGELTIYQSDESDFLL